MITGLTGLAGSGKSEVANYLQKEHGFYRVNMKDALIKEIKQNFTELLKVIALTESMTVDELFVKKPPLMRALMQNYGTDVRRKDDERYWINKWSEVADSLVKAGKSIVVDDVRFLNEADAIKLRNGSIMRVERSDLTEPMGHISETEMAKIYPDTTITSDKGAVSELLEMVEVCVKAQTPDEEE